LSEEGNGMDELQRLLTLKSEVKDEIRRGEEKLKALEIVEKMMREASERANVVPLQSKQYKNVKQDEAIQDVLRRAPRKLTSKEISDALQRGGYEFDSKKPQESVYSTLHVNSKGLYIKEKVGSTAVFGLAEQKPKVETGTTS